MIIGSRTILLPFDEKYRETVRNWINQPDVRAGTGTKGPVSDSEHSRWYDELIADPSKCAFVIGSGADKDATPVGLTGLSNINLHSRSAEYWIYIGDGPSRRKGFASDATFLILKFAFDALALHRIYLQVIQSNLPALNLYRKFGFIEEGVARDHLFVGGSFVNMIQFSMLESEFRALAPRKERTT
jgi:RimJ/RimL family protein N-acetyltransferase